MKNRFIGLHPDFIGFSASMLCALHCAIFPFVLSLAPLAGLKFLHDPWFEYFLILLSAVIAVYSLVNSNRKHHKKWNAVVVMLIGFTFILLGRFTSNEWLEVIITVMGATVVALAHFINWKYIREGNSKLPGCFNDNTIQ